MNVSILEFGATPNADGLQNTFIQNAIDHCFLNGGGEVVVPSGKYLVSGIRLRSNVTLRLLSGANLVGSRKIEDYRVLLDEDAIEPLPERIMPEIRKPQDETDLRMYYCAIIHIYAANNVAIIGEKGAVIDGQNCYNPNGEEGFRGPHCINVLKSSSVTFKGYTAQHAGGDTHCIWASKNLLCEHLTLLGGNNGISLYKTKKITVRYCDISTGNDCFVGFNNHDVFIEDNELNTSCNCFRFAGTNVTIRHCNAQGPGKYGHRLTMPKQALIDGEIATADDHGVLLDARIFQQGGRKDHAALRIGLGNNGFFVQEQHGSLRHLALQLSDGSNVFLPFFHGIHLQSRTAEISNDHKGRPQFFPLLGRYKESLFRIHTVSIDTGQYSGRHNAVLLSLKMSVVRTSECRDDESTPTFGVDFKDFAPILLHSAPLCYIRTPIIVYYRKYCNREHL